MVVLIPAGNLKMQNDQEQELMDISIFFGLWFLSKRESRSRKVTAYQFTHKKQYIYSQGKQTIVLAPIIRSRSLWFLKLRVVNHERFITSNMFEPRMF